MGGGPVNTPALRAEGELFLRRKDVSRDSALDLLLGHRKQNGIAVDAAGEGLLERVQTISLNHLLELLAKMVALDEKVVGRVPFSDASIPRQDQTILLARFPNQPVTR